MYKYPVFLQLDIHTSGMCSSCINSFFFLSIALLIKYLFQGILNCECYEKILTLVVTRVSVCQHCN